MLSEKDLQRFMNHTVKVGDCLLWADIHIHHKEGKMRNFLLGIILGTAVTSLAGDPCDNDYSYKYKPYKPDTQRERYEPDDVGLHPGYNSSGDRIWCQHVC